jgi:LDH2 family malate/lactate/ureidoglycolate dehydrogenase
MPPWGGTNPILGTNPIAIAIPTEDHPFVLDIASTAASHGSIKVAAQQGDPMPEGWVVDADGRPITDPARADEGFLVPMGGYKGAGLTIAFGLLAGVLNGAAFGAEVIDHRHELGTPTNTGQAIMVLRADLFRPQDDVVSALTGHLSALRNSGTRDGGPVRLPGDGAAATRRDNEENGVPVPGKLATDLDTLARRLGVGSPFIQQESS